MTDIISYWSMNDDIDIRFTNRNYKTILPPFICINCNLFLEENEAIILTNCQHKYCIECIPNIINKSLSQFNQTPKCIDPNCQKTLRFPNFLFILSKINKLLYRKYQTPQNNLQQKQEYLITFRNDQFLLNGYIREIWYNLTNTSSSSIKIIIPQEIILLINDFFKLCCLTQIKCSNCNNFVFNGKSCTHCDGTGFTMKCQNCLRIGSIPSDITCNQCKNGIITIRRMSMSIIRKKYFCTDVMDMVLL